MAVLTRNIVTDHGAVDGGTAAQNNAAFDSFNTWALANQGTDEILLTIPAGAGGYTISGSRYIFKSIKKLTVSGYGATLIGSGAPGFFLGGLGQQVGTTFHARTQSVSAGSNSVTLVDASKASIFTVGLWALMTGFDMQGIYGKSYGQPSNPHFFQYVKLTNISAGVITFDSPLTDSYLSTWPHYADGTAFELEQGGPATLYALDASWDSVVEYQGLTIDQSTQTYANARSVTYRDCVGTGAHGFIPSQNNLWAAYGCNLSACNMEVDKLIKTLIIDNVIIDQIKIQSSSIGDVTISNSTVTTNPTSNITGAGKTLTLTNTAVTTIQPGAYVYGRTDEVTISDCAVTTFQTGGFSDNLTTMGLHMAAGVIYYRNGDTVTGAADNGSGKVRLTVGDTTDFVTGQNLDIHGISGTTEANNGIETSASAITVVDGTHLDLLNVAFVHAYSGSGGGIGNKAPRWGVPGTWCYFKTASLENLGMFQVLSVTQDATYTYVNTSWSGGFPSGANQIHTHPAPRITCRNNTGAATLLDLNQAPARAPLYSYAKRTYIADASGTSDHGKFVMWGNISTLKFTVTDDYVGAGNLTFSLSQFDNWPVVKPDLSTGSFSTDYGSVAACNVKATTGTVTTITPVTLGANVWMAGQSNSGPVFSANVTNGETPTVVMEFVTDQGIPAPGATYGRSLRLPQLHA